MTTIADLRAVLADDTRGDRAVSVAIIDFLEEQMSPPSERLTRPLFTEAPLASIVDPTASAASPA